VATVGELLDLIAEFTEARKSAEDELALPATVQRLDEALSEIIGEHAEQSLTASA
jgi:hypothetical protein